MSKVERVAIPARTTFNCDRCSAQDINVDAKIETMDRDFQGGIVYSHFWHLCKRCRNDFAEWIKAFDDV